MKLRSDLSKQLDLVIKQEIKNYNDSLALIFSKINDANIAIEETEDGIKRVIASLITTISNLETRMSNLESKQVLDYYNLSKSIGNIDCTVNSLVEKINIVIAAATKCHDTSVNNTIDINDLDKRISEIEDEFVEHCDNFENEVTALRYHVRDAVDRSKEEILNLPSEAQRVHNELNEKFNCHQVDVKGVLEEVRSTNRSLRILEKNIEYLHTRLDRLKREDE